MECLIAGKKVRINPYRMKHDKFLGEGTSAKVYLVNGEAYKFYKPYCKKEEMSKEAIEILRKINTMRIILPKEPILDKKRKLCGYISKYIEDLGYNDLEKYSKDKLLESLYLLRKDLITLGNNGVTARDFYIENTVFNNGIYIIDCGRFLVGENNYNDENLSCSDNLELFDEFLIRDIICKGSYRSDEYVKFKYELRKAQRDGIDLLDYIDTDMHEKTFSEYIEGKLRR